MLKNLIWDFDGTLYDTYPTMAGAMHKALKNHGYSADYDLIYSKMKVSVGHCMKYFGSFVDIDDEFTEEYKSIRRELEGRICHPFPGAVELLSDIIKAGKKNYMYTHRDTSLYPLLEKAGMSGLFEDMVIASDGFPSKPAPDAIEHIVAKHGLIKCETAMVGDRQIDIDSGINAGVRTIAYCDGSGAEIINSDFVARNMNELRSIILG